MEKKLFTISIIVNNQFGVLARVVGLFSKRGYNIEFLNASALGDTGLSRIIIISEGTDSDKMQIEKQLRKLHDVQSVGMA